MHFLRASAGVDPSKYFLPNDVNTQFLFSVETPSITGQFLKHFVYPYTFEWPAKQSLTQII